MTRTDNIKVHITPDTKARLVELADGDDRTVSTYVARLLENHMGHGAATEHPTDEIGEAGYTYLIKSSGYYKVGRARNVERRLVAMSLPEKPQVIAAVLCADYGRLEMALHVLLANKRVNGEWFRLTEEDVHAVKHLLESRAAEAPNVVELRKA